MQKALLLLSHAQVKAAAKEDERERSRFKLSSGGKGGRAALGGDSSQKRRKSNCCVFVLSFLSPFPFVVKESLFPSSQVGRESEISLQQTPKQLQNKKAALGNARWKNKKKQSSKKNLSTRKEDVHGGTIKTRLPCIVQWRG